MKDAETLLGIALPASADEIKRAYRRQISRYHPDKVHHLGEEFQLMAAEKCAQLRDAYQRVLESSGSDQCADTDAAPAPAPHHVNPTSSWQAVASGCPSLILGAAVERVTQSVRLTLPRREEFTVAGFSLACRTRTDWRGLLKRRPSEGIFLRTPSEAAPATTRLRHLLPGVDGAIVLFDLVLDSLATDPREPAGRRPSSSRGEPDVFGVTVDAMTWKARVPPHAPEIAHLIVAHLRDSRV